MPYPIALSANDLHLNCSLLGVDKPYPLFSIKKITGKSQTAAVLILS